MARRGGFDFCFCLFLNIVIKKDYIMQRQMEETGKELEEKTYTATVGGGAVEVAVSGKKELVSVKLAEEVVDPDDIEMLQDLIVAAVNEALREATKESEEAMARITGGMSSGLGGFGL
ncbi:MAG: YbaB/EbfC family nucleoid-associated protein [Lachnospiraceae bacterium]|nr:YbaB/EbfC family nucleoid-associated protein [Lachnospiraceae bacterium]